MPKHGIIITNTGSPAAPTPEAVRAYLAEFLTDPRIRPMHPVLWNAILKSCILPQRSEASAAKYRQVWTEAGSPLDACMRSLADKLRESLESNDADMAVRYAMSYGKPTLLDSLTELKAQGCEELTVVPLYPQSAYSTTKVVEDKLGEALRRLGWQPELRFISSYSETCEYRSAIASSIVAAGFDPSRDALLMAFHSVPMKDIKAGDKYAEQVRESSKAIAAELGAHEGRWQTGFQCRFDKNRKWLGPSTREALDRLDLADGRLFAVAPNFSIDCLETLYDIKIELKREFEARCASCGDTGAANFIYVPCLNDSDTHVQLIESIIADQQVYY